VIEAEVVKNLLDYCWLFELDSAVAVSLDLDAEIFIQFSFAFDVETCSLDVVKSFVDVGFFLAHDDEVVYVDE